MRLLKINNYILKSKPIVTSVKQNGNHSQSIKISQKVTIFPVRHLNKKYSRIVQLWNIYQARLVSRVL